MSTLDTARDLAIVFLGCGAFIWALKQTWEQFAPLILPGLKKVRDQLLRDHIEEERTARHALELALNDHQSEAVETAHRP